MEPRARRDPGDHLLWYLLCTDGETEAGHTARKWQAPCFVRPADGPLLLAWDIRGPGHVGRLTFGCVCSIVILQHPGIPSLSTLRPSSVRQVL